MAATVGKEPSEILKVLHLRRFWERRMLAFDGEAAEPEGSEMALDNVLVNGLGLSFEEIAQFLNRRPPFDEFERWILDLNGGNMDPLWIERINCVVAGGPHSEAVERYLAEVEQADDVLTADDLSFWEEHGYVIVRQAISPEQARAAEAAVWEHLSMAPDDPATWYQKPIGKGIMTGLYHHPALTANRGSLRIRKAYAQIWQTADLWTTTDRAGFNPPENADFRFPGPQLHWDMSLTPPVELGTHGIIYLCDVGEEQGAFTGVPGFHRRLDSWLSGLPVGVDPRREILNSPTRSIAANAGDLIIWHHALPHGSSPNRGNRPRIVQYINMYPLDLRPEKAWR